MSYHLRPPTFRRCFTTLIVWAIGLLIIFDGDYPLMTVVGDPTLLHMTWLLIMGPIFGGLMLFLFAKTWVEKQ